MKKNMIQNNYLIKFIKTIIFKKEELREILFLKHERLKNMYLEHQRLKIKN
jgi:hypothetical protein